MDHRREAFLKKFTDAAQHLGATPAQLVSLKMRDNVTSYDEYKELLRHLDQEAGIRSAKIEGAFQGTSYLVELSNTKVVIVEHETGLEILYIAGSIASLISIVPLILRCWNVLRGDRNGGHRPLSFRSIESRRFNENGELVEDRVDALNVPWAAPLSVMNSAILSAAELIDVELQRLKTIVESFDQRLATVEANAVSKSTTRKDKTAKNAKNKKRKSK